MGNRIWSGVRGALGTLTVPFLAIIAGLLVGTLFILIAGKDPVEAYAAFAKSVAGSPRSFGDTLMSSTPLILMGLAIALAFRCGLFNIGVEGQYLVGMLTTAVVSYSIPLPPVLAQLVAILAGMAAGGLWAAVPGLLKAYRGVHEVINTIMLNYTGLFLTHYLLLAYFRDPTYTGGATRPAPESAILARNIIEGSRLHHGLWIALFVAFLVWVFLWRTPAGYEIRAVGFSAGAAEYAGISVKRNIVLAMVLSGALAGMTGAVQTLGVYYRFFEPMGFEGYGFTGIAVALVGQNHPVGVVLSALLFGALNRGGPAMQLAAGVPKQVTWIVQGTIIFFVAAEGLWRFMKNKRVKTEVKKA